MSSSSSSSLSSHADNTEFPDPHSLSLSLSLSLSHTHTHHSLLADPLDSIQCPHRVDVCKSLLIGRYWGVHLWSLWENVTHELVHPYFISRIQHVPFILIGCFVRREVSGRTTAVLWFIFFQNLLKTARRIRVLYPSNFCLHAFC